MVRIAGSAALAGVLALALFIALPYSPERGSAPRPAPNWGKAELAFEPNAGRVPGGADYYARVSGATVALSRAGARLELGAHALTSRLIGAAGAKPQPEAQLQTRVNSFVGSDPARWREGLPTYGRIRYAAVYPGIDLVYHGRRGALEYDFELAPGADPSRIAMALAGARDVRIAPNGDLVAKVGRGQIRHQRPVAYQEGDRVDARFSLQGNRLGFELGAYDHSKPLVIDPVLAYSDYIGGSASDWTEAVAADSSGNVYVTGVTYSTSISAAPGSSPTPASRTGMTMKIQPGGGREWVTYLGEWPKDIAVNPAGGVSITGVANSSLAVTAGAADTSFGGGAIDAFAARLNGDGSPNWVTFLGGTASDSGHAIAVDQSGATYVGGNTDSTTGIATGGTFQAAGGPNDGMLVKYSSSGAKLFGTYFGGNGADAIDGLGVNPGCASNCDIFVAGGTTSTTHPWKTTAASISGTSDAFAARINSAATGRTWATYEGGTQGENVGGLAVSPTTGNPSFVGGTDSFGGGGQAYLRTFRASDGLNVGLSLEFGGSADEDGTDIAYDAQGNIYITGNTISTNFPATQAVQPNTGGSTDAFAVKYRPSSVFPVWSTYLGGFGSDYGYGIGTDTTGGAYVVGTTDSTDFPVVGAKQGSAGGDGFISKIQVRGAVIDSGPEGTLRSRTAAFTYSSGETGASFQCRLQPVQADFSSCPNAGSSYTGLADGPYKFEVQSFDGVGTPGQVTSRDFRVDTKPLAQLVIAPNPVLIGRVVTFDGSTSSAADTTIAKYEWDLDGDGTFERDTGTTGTTTNIYAAPRAIDVSLRVTDGLGAVGTTTGKLVVSSPTGTVGQIGVSINKGAQYTKSPNVTVNVVFPPATTSFLFSNDGGFLDPTTFQPASSIKWKLDSSGPERLPKTIYVRFLVGAFAGETFQDDIILDETPPKVQQAIVAPAAAATAGARASALRRWRVRVRATDSNSGVSRIQVTANKRKPGRLLRYKRRLTVRSAKRPRFVRARDRAGNYSRWRRAR